MSQILFIVFVVATPIAAIVGCVTLIRLLLASTPRALVTDASACLACWALGSIVFGWISQLGAGDNAPADKMLAFALFYGVSCFVVGAALICGAAAIRYQLIRRRQQLSPTNPKL